MTEGMETTVDNEIQRDHVAHYPQAALANFLSVQGRFGVSDPMEIPTRDLTRDLSGTDVLPFYRSSSFSSTSSSASAFYPLSNITSSERGESRSTMFSTTEESISFAAAAADSIGDVALAGYIRQYDSGADNENDYAVEEPGDTMSLSSTGTVVRHSSHITVNHPMVSANFFLNFSHDDRERSRARLSAAANVLLAADVSFPEDEHEFMESIEGVRSGPISSMGEYQTSGR